MFYFTSKFLTKNSANKLYSMIEDDEWHDGVESLNFGSKKPEYDMNLIKNNLECGIKDPSIIHFVLDSNKEFLKNTYALLSTDPIISKTPTGGYYHSHFDEPGCGHFSTTIFLSDPDTYDGGELVLLIDGEEKMFKLQAGEGITYETGTPHRVNKVTRGDRYAAVFWTTSFIQDLDDLDEWRYYDMMADRYKDNSYYEDLISFNNSLYAHFKQKCDKISRKYVNASP